jgi:hypothetical protein
MFGEITSRMYTFNRVDKDGNDATTWFSTIKSLYPYASVLLKAVGHVGKFQQHGRFAGNIQRKWDSDGRGRRFFDQR